MAGFIFVAKDWLLSRVTPDCLKAKVEEGKDFMEKNMPKGVDEHGGDGGGMKITEYEAGWNVTNAILFAKTRSRD